MLLTDLSDYDEVIVNYLILLQRLTEAENTGDIETQEIINKSITLFNNRFSNKVFFEPSLSVGNLKKIFPDYQKNPPCFKIFKG